MSKQNLITLIEYINSTYDIALETRVQTEIEARTKTSQRPTESEIEKYETLLRKEEANIRQHISVSINIYLHIYID